MTTPDLKLSAEIEEEIARKIEERSRVLRKEYADNMESEVETYALNLPDENREHGIRMGCRQREAAVADFREWYEWEYRKGFEEELASELRQIREDLEFDATEATA